MRETKRTLKKACSVGEYTFDVAINRQIVLDAFVKFPELWKLITKAGKDKDAIANPDKIIDDIDALARLMGENDALEELIPAFVRYILPKMVEVAESELDCDEFLDYCERMECDDEFNSAIFDFAMLGFTDGKSEKKPKVKVSLN